MKQTNDREELEREFLKYCSDFIIKISYTDERYLLSFIETHTQKKVKEAYKKGISDVEKNIEYNAQTKVWEIPEEKILSLNKGDK